MKITIINLKGFARICAGSLIFIALAVPVFIGVNEYIYAKNVEKYEYLQVAKTGDTTFMLKGEFNIKMYYNFVSFLNQVPKNTKKINIAVFHTGGGYLYVADKIKREIKNRGLKYDYICLYVCMSAGLYIAFEAENIYYTEFATMMYHYPSYIARVNESNLEALNREVREEIIKQTFIFAKVLKMKPIDLYNIVILEGDMYINANRANKLGLGKTIDLLGFLKLLNKLKLYNKQGR